MIPPVRSVRRCATRALLLSLALSGCASSNPQGTHEGRLLDNKVAAERVHAALRKSGPQFRHVEVDASKEGLTLIGSVASSEDRSRAEEIARGVERDVHLTDELSVR